MRPSERGLSSVYGFIVIYLLIMASMSALANVASSELSVQNSVNRAREVDSAKKTEQLTLFMQNGSVVVSNAGPISSTLAYEIIRYASSSAQLRLNYPLSVGSSVSLSIPTGAKRVGIVTSTGNVFWYPPTNTDTLPNSCSSGLVTLTMQVSPKDSGSTTPPGVSSFCAGQSIQISATPAQGFVFASWTGSGPGSYSGTSNPANLTLGGQLSETANFVAGVSVSITPSADGLPYGSGVSRSATLTVRGIPQTVSFTTGPLPQGIGVVFDPPSLTDSLLGASTTMTISYVGSSSGLYPIVVISTGADGQTAYTTFNLYVTLPNGNWQPGIYPADIGQPREHKTLFWKGTYYLFYSQRAAIYYTTFFYNNGWQAGYPSTYSSWPPFGVNFDVYQNGNLVVLVNGLGYNFFYYNLGIISGTQNAIAWRYSTGSAGMGTPVYTRYYVQGHLSTVMDNSGNVWTALTTTDNTHYYIEVLENLNGAWSEVYISPSFQVEPLPQILFLPNGYIVLVYTFVSQPCYGDYFTYTADGGNTWKPPEGPMYANGSPTCYAQSSATFVKDTVYLGGRNSAGDLAFWSYNFDTGLSYSSPAIQRSVDYSAMTSVNGVLVLAFTRYNAGALSEQLFLTWSYDGGGTWVSSPPIDYINNFLTLPLVSNTYQIPIADTRWSNNFLQGDFYTI